MNDDTKKDDGDEKDQPTPSTNEDPPEPEGGTLRPPTITVAGAAFVGALVGGLIGAALG